MTPVVAIALVVMMSVVAMTLVAVMTLVVTSEAVTTSGDDVSSNDASTDVFSKSRYAPLETPPCLSLTAQFCFDLSVFT